jgi:nitrate reductase delta subunit
MSRPALHQAASLLLTYPDSDWPTHLRIVRTVAAQLPASEGTLLLQRFC